MIRSGDLSIYLDIDGVLTGNKSSKRSRAKFIKHVLKYHKGSAYWLTTHCNREKNRSAEYLHFNSDLPKKLINQMDEEILPAYFDISKTDGIDFSKPFLWFDDNLFAIEEAALRKHGALDNYVKIDAKSGKAINNALKLLKRKEGSFR